MPLDTPLILGIGGIFLRRQDKAVSTKWYSETFGFEPNDLGGYQFFWRFPGESDRIGQTVWGLFESESRYFEGPCMVNYIVADLEATLAHLKSLGIEPERETESYSYGKFSWIKDPEGAWIELWEPTDEAA